MTFLTFFAGGWGVFDQYATDEILGDSGWLDVDNWTRPGRWTP